MSEHGPESFDLRRRAERRLNPDGFTELVPAPGADPTIREHLNIDPRPFGASFRCRQRRSMRPHQAF